MPRKVTVNEKALTKMELRKLNALKRSIGDELGTKAFKEWLEKRPDTTVGPHSDKAADEIASTVEKLIAQGKIKRLPRRGYNVKRGRGRVIVEQAA